MRYRPQIHSLTIWFIFAYAAVALFIAGLAAGEIIVTWLLAR